MKKKWDDGLYFMAQDVCIQDTLRPNRAVHRLAIMGFVRTTCVRAGSMARDWFDRAGLSARWVGVNILSVKHFEWDREGYRIDMPDGLTVCVACLCVRACVRVCAAVDARQRMCVRLDRLWR